ncbi:MAG: xanthine dehydrogenase family protein molybdopterin-binding subunit [Chloroflexota bacterium]|nr:xanthine dehydrogenase family protein molybdopterin-binding subunit [Chloroflexota bacterium]
MPYTQIGKSVPRIESREKVTGEAAYSCDVRLPGMLWGKCKRSPYPFARILSIDISKALKVPGVRTVLTAHNSGQGPFGEFVTDQYPFCDQYAYYVGDEVAAVAAVDEDAAEEAVDLIEVEYEQLTPVFDPEEALKPGAPAVHPELESIKQNLIHRIDIERGEGEAAFKYADVILDERFTTQPQHQCYMQPRDCVAEWSGDRLTLRAVTQSPFRMRPGIARACGIPEDHVRMIPMVVGGGFGNNAARIWPIAGLLARKAGKPVRINLTREEDFISGRPFVPAVIYMKMGFKNDGTIVAKKMDLILNAGGYVGSCLGISTVASGRADNMYRMTNVKTSSRLVYTNNVPCGALRGYGTQLATFGIESMMDMAADKLGMDPTEIRLKNASQKGDTTVHGFIFNSCGLSDAIKRGAKESGWTEKRKQGGKYHGIGMATGIHVSGARVILPVFEGSSAICHIDYLGKVRIISGETDIGQGSNTIFAQIAAEELGVDIDDVKITPVDTDLSPFAKGSFGDRVTSYGGAAVKKAAAAAKAQLIIYAAEVLKTSPDKLELRDKKFYAKGSTEALSSLEQVARQVVLKRAGMPVIGIGDYCVPEWVVESDVKSKYYGNYSIAYTFLSQIAEVVIDPETGKVDVKNVWSVVDLGKAINPKSCEGQVEGGVMMGLGYALSEDYIVKNGTLLNCNFTDYKIATTGNTPPIHTYFLETIDPHTPYGAKAVGEAIGDPTAAVVANAVFHATGVRIKDLPITPEKILKALKEKKG